MSEGKFPASWILFLSLISGIISQKFLSINPEYLLMLFVFSAIFCVSFSLIFRKISIIFLIIFTSITGTFLVGNSGTGYIKQLPLPEKEIKCVYGTVKDVREKGVLTFVSLENTMVSNGKKWFETNIEVRTILPAETKIYPSDNLLLYELKKIKQENNQLIVSAKSWSVSEPDFLLNHFYRKFRIITENIIRKWFKYHAQEAAIFRMIVLGDKRQSLEIKNVFVRTGTYHLLIVSGIHLGYLVIFLRILCFPFRHIEQAHYKIFNIFYLLSIVFYSFITGFSTPVVRAALMFGIYLLCEIIERPVSGIESVGWAGFIILFLKPVELFNMGFQLSFAATTGIVLTMKYIPPVKKLPSYLDSSIRAILGAQICTIPVMLGNLGTFYPAGLISNFFLVPLGGLVVGLGFAFLIFAFLRILLIFPLIKLLELFWISTKLFSSISPEVYLQLQISGILTIYSIVFLILFRKKWKILTPVCVSFLLLWLINPFQNKKVPENIPQKIPSSVEAITIFPCKKLLCMVENKDSVILIISEKEDNSTLTPAVEKISSMNKNVILFFTSPAHDIFTQIEFPLKYVKPVLILENSAVRRHPAFGYRKCFFMPEEKIKQAFWQFLTPYENIRVIYNEKNRIAIECRFRGKTIIVSTYMNSKMFEKLPFSPQYHTIYATELVLSKKLTEYFEDYEVRQVLYQKKINSSIPDMMDYPSNFYEIKNEFVIQ